MSHKIIKFGMLALVALALTYCQREDAPEAPQQDPVPAVDPEAVVSLNEAKSLFEASENQKRTANSVSRRKYPFIELETDWRYFEQTQTLVGDAYSKIPITIVGSDLSAEMLFLKEDGVTEPYLFITEPDSLTNDNRIVNADFYLFTPKGQFISAYRMTDGVISHQLVPKVKANYRLVVDTDVTPTGRKRPKKTKGTPASIKVDGKKEDSGGLDNGNGSGGGGGVASGDGGDAPIQLEPVNVYGTRPAHYGSYPTYNGNNYENFTKEKDPKPSENGIGGGNGGSSSSDVGVGIVKGGKKSKNMRTIDDEEKEKKEEAPVLDRPDHPISDNKCFFSTVDLNKGATLTIYVDEPIPGTGEVVKGLNVGHTFIGITQGENQYTYGFYPNVPGYKTVTNDNFSSVLGKDDRHTFSVSFSAEISPEQLQKIIDLSKKSYGRQYNLSYSNCTDFAISVANLANITLPYCKGTWKGGGGSAPGVLGNALRNSPAFKGKINTSGGKAPASKGNGC
ncbi:hypothetical protein HMPREF1321_1348 [Capnocytophaga sp. oral taxon 412 str. F0487]|uniref:hypothetical protein n=1 Tax=Capnocytophaga sp. oral taxon 412 TaxID=712218 RepID=UPI00026964D5|nr:hypothetical protein [Capnocytophaga sp. oral taxon 412]EIW91934.1 hypothetical protein HMPREF1321_1348 [Capnocytophaga sp. oral taxon 412 str. F0487]